MVCPHPNMKAMETMEQGTAARRAVFDTCELREAIIASLPPRKIWTVRIVSKTWYHAIKTSRLLHRAQRLMPIEQDLDLSKRHDQYEGCNVPTYAAGSKIELHPSLDSNHGIERDIGPRKVIRFGVSARFWHVLRKKAGEYATLPPCQAIGTCFET